jgi:hypothetical protein
MKAQIDVQAELAKISAIRTLQKPLRYKTSKLEKYRADLLALRHAGASYPDLVVWLKSTHRMQISHTTIMRYLKSLPEFTDSIKEDRNDDSIDLSEFIDG